MRLIIDPWEGELRRRRTLSRCLAVIGLAAWQEFVRVAAGQQLWGRGLVLQPFLGGNSKMMG